MTPKRLPKAIPIASLSIIIPKTTPKSIPIDRQKEKLTLFFFLLITFKFPIISECYLKQQPSESVFFRFPTSGIPFPGQIPLFQTTAGTTGTKVRFSRPDTSAQQQKSAYRIADHQQHDSSHRIFLHTHTKSPPTECTTKDTTQANTVVYEAANKGHFQLPDSFFMAASVAIHGK